MTITPAQLVPTQPVSSTAAVVYTVPAGSRAQIKTLVLTNVTGATVAVSINRVPSGGSAATGNLVLSGYQLGANATYVADEFAAMYLESGAALEAIAGSAAAVNISVAGLLF